MSYKVTKKRVKELVHSWMNTKVSIYSNIKRATDSLDQGLINEIVRCIENHPMYIENDDHLRDLVYRVMPRIVFMADENGIVKIIPLFVHLAFEKENENNL